MTQNCLGCAHYFKCSDPNKRERGREYSCHSWEAIDLSASGLSLEATNETKSKKIASVLLDPAAIDEKEAFAAELGLEKMWDEVLNSKSPVPPDLVVDDRDFKEFGNFFDFCMAKDGLTAGTPFPRQLWLIANLLGDACGNPKCTDPKWFDVNNIPVGLKNIYDLQEMVTFFHNGVCPKCKQTRAQQTKKKIVRRPNEGYACVGQRAGKSTTLSMLSSYILHKYLKLQNPTAVFGLFKGSILTASFVALTFGRAQNLLWNPIQNMLMNSEWFNNYHAMLDDVGARKGIELYKKPGGIMLQYRHRDLYLAPSGPSKRTLRGDTRFFYVVDEAGLFPIDGNVDDKERMSIFETHTSLKNSTLTLREAARRQLRKGYSNIPTALGVYISSPMSHRDFIMRGVKENVGNKRALVMHLPSWKFNPDLSEKSLRREFKNEPVKFERDFGANPPLSENPFFDVGDHLQSTFALPASKVEYKYKTFKDPRAALKQKWAEIIATRNIGMVPVSAMAIDAGEVNNSFSMAIGHVETSREPRIGIVRTVKVTSIIEIAPKVRHSAINYNKIAERTLYPLISKFNVAALVSDRWQNKKFLHDAMAKYPNLYAENYSLTYEDIVEFRDHLMDDRPGILLPHPEIPFDEIDRMETATDYPHCFRYKPVAHTYFQMQTVQDAGNQVAKGAGLTDDNLRAVFLLCKFLLDPAWCKAHMKGSSIRGSSGIGVVAGRTGAMSLPRGAVMGSGASGVLGSRGLRFR